MSTETTSGLRKALATIGDDFASIPGLREIREEDRPSLDKMIAYGKHGKYAPQEGSFRTAGVVYSYFAVATHAAGYYALWVFERPSRAGVAATLATVFTFTPVGSAAWTLVARVAEFLAHVHH